MTEMTLTPNEAAALELAKAHAESRGSITSDFIAARMDEPYQTRKWAGVLGSLARKGLLQQRSNGFLNKTFWLLPGQSSY